MSTVTIRKAHSGDEESIATVQILAWQMAYREFMGIEFLNSLSVENKKMSWLNVLSNPSEKKCLIAEVHGGIQGFAVVGPARDSDLDMCDCELMALNVNPGHWRSKVGSSLISAVFDSISKDNYLNIHLWVIKNNTPAIELYKKFGFMESGVYKLDSSHTGNAVEEARYSLKLKN